MRRPGRTWMAPDRSRCFALAAAVAKILALMILSVGVLVMAIASFSASAVFFAICPPLLVFLSPILAPLGLMLLFLCLGLALFFGSCIAFVSALVWAYKRSAIGNGRSAEASQFLPQSTAPHSDPSA